MDFDKFWSINKHCTVPTRIPLGSVLSGTTHNACTVEYTLLSICSENVLTMHLVIRRQAQARASVRMHSVRAYVMPYHIVNLQN